MDTEEVEPDAGRKRGYGTISGAMAIEDPEPTSCMPMLRAWPKSTFLIIVNEFCERFSYYGMRSVLTLYLINILKYSANTATILYHSFNVLCYGSPMIGSIIADGYIGKFWTIFFISIFYACGQIALAVASTFGPTSSLHPWLDLLGLFVIGMGTGGIKPCVSAFGGDQFKQHYLLMISIYFSVFYFTINAGSTISSFISPIMRSQPCLGHDSCYPLSFGIPAILMIVAVGIFMLGSPLYKKVPPKENTIFRVLAAIRRSLGNKLRGKKKRDHWLDHYFDTHDCETDPHCREAKGKCVQVRFIDDVKQLVRISVIMLPLPFFWTLYDQQGSRWVIQAVAMDSRISDGFSLLPDQMSTLNALLIMIFIPIFQGLIYPGVERMGIRCTPLRKMVAGVFLAAVSFVICGFVQIAVNRTLPDIPGSSQAFVSVVNAYPSGTCDFEVNLPDFSSQVVPANSSLIDNELEKTKQLYRLHVGSGMTANFQFARAASSSNCTIDPFTVAATLKGGKSYMVTLLPGGRSLIREASWDKPQEGQGQFALGVNMAVPCARFEQLNGTSCSASSFNGSFALCRYDKECDPQKHDWYYAWKSSDDKAVKRLDVQNGSPAFALDYLDIKPGTYKLYLVNYLKDYSGDHTPRKSEIQTLSLDVYVQVNRMGGVYTLTVTDQDDLEGSPLIATLHTIVPENHMNILWQVPQYFVITAAEILFSITGLEFAYSQSSPSLKAVVTAMWLFTQALGDAVIIVIDELDLFQNLAVEFFVYSGILFVVVVVLLLLSIFYYEYKEVMVETDGGSVKVALENSGYVDDEGTTKL
ncbi:unnamed protein product, partial [Mesorhabditis spiculigera]